MYTYGERQRLDEPPGRFSLSTLVLLGYATAFFPRLLTYFGAPSLLNFAHLCLIPLIFVVTLSQARTRDPKQIEAVKSCIFGLLVLLICFVASAVVNFAGIPNILVQYLLLTEPYLLLISILAIPISESVLKRIQFWILGFALFNMLLAIAQFFLIPIGLFPSSGQLLTDNTAGVFVADGGSAGNYVSCTVSLYFGIYYFSKFPGVAIWIRSVILFLAAVQTQISDSKQVFLAVAMGWAVLSVSNLKDIRKAFLYLISFTLVVSIFIWCLYNVEGTYLDHYRNWTTGREGLYGPDGVATQTKLAAFRIVPSYFTSPLNWFFGLGPGHTVTWFGGWILPKYANLLVPLGATIHPASAKVFQVVSDGWIAQESTVYFPLFTWAGIWGDLGIVGLGGYLFLGSILWRKVCVDDLTRFLILSTACFGFILSQMEEPGHVLSVAVLLGVRWHESRLLSNT